jgi:hypothetical protein
LCCSHKIETDTPAWNAKSKACSTLEKFNRQPIDEALGFDCHDGILRLATRLRAGSTETMNWGGTIMVDSFSSIANGPLNTWPEMRSARR